MQLSILAQATTGIAWTIAAILGTATIFLLVKIAQSLLTSGSFLVEAKPLGLLNQSEIKLDAKFSNTTLTSKVMSDLSIYGKEEGKTILIAKLEGMPIIRGNSSYEEFLVKKGESYSLLIPRGKSFSAIISFKAISNIHKAEEYCLVYSNEKGRSYRSKIKLGVSSTQNLRFSHFKKR